MNLRVRLSTARTGRCPTSAPSPCDTGGVLLGRAASGGPVERLAQALRREGSRGEVVAATTSTGWRRLMTSGRLGRLAARSAAFTLLPARMMARAVRDRPRALVPTTAPFVLPPVMVATRPLHRRPVVPLLYDLYPDAMEAAGMVRRETLASRAVAALNRYWLQRADGVVFIGRRMADHTRGRYGEPRRWAVIETGADRSEFEAASLGEPGPRTELERFCEGRVVLAYVGNMGEMHDWRTLEEAIPELLERVEGEIPVAVVMAASGSGAEHLRQRWAELDPERVRFTGPLPDRDWARLMARTDVALVSLRPEAARVSVPSKAFSALAAGAALAAVAPEGSDLGDLIREHGCGERLDPGDVGGTVEALERMVRSREILESYRRRAREASEHYDLSVLARRWRAFLDEAIEGDQRSSSGQPT